jgi:hypothetical protein
MKESFKSFMEGVVEVFKLIGELQRAAFDCYIVLTGDFPRAFDNGG